jgi:hypothetical protein
MKIDLTTSVVQKQVSTVRRQITKAEDLKSFDAFLSELQIIDFKDEVTASKARACCGGDHCCENITVSLSLT